MGGEDEVVVVYLLCYMLMTIFSCALGLAYAMKREKEEGDGCHSPFVLSFLSFDVWGSRCMGSKQEDCDDFKSFTASKTAGHRHGPLMRGD